MVDQGMPLPLVIRQRAQRILNQPVAICYRVEENNPNLIKCVMVGMDRVYYVDLLTNKQVNALSIQVIADEAGKEDTLLLTGDNGRIVKDGDFVPIGTSDISFDEPIKDEGGIANELPSTDIKKVSNRKPKQLEHKVKAVKKAK